VQEETKEFSELIEHANTLIERDAEKNKAQTEMLRLHRLDWGEDIWKKPENVRETRDTQPFDAVNWSVDILSVHEPTITIELPREQPGVEEQPVDPMAQIDQIASGAFADPMGGMGMPDPMMGMMPPPMAQSMEQQAAPEEYNPTELSETLEAMARNALRHNDQRRKSALLRDFLYSVFLFDECIAKVADLRMSPQWDKSPAFLRTRSPFAVKACLPMTVHTEWDEYGLAGVLHRYKRPLREIKNQYSDVNGAVSLFEADPEGNVVFCEWWTRDEMCQWIEKSGVKSTESTDTQNKTQSELLLEPIKANTLGFIPFVVRTGRGSQLFEMAEEQISPLLYGGWKSKIFFRANLFLSVVSTLAFAQANPKWVYQSETGDKTFDLNFNFPEVLPAKVGEKIDPLPVGVNADLYEMLKEFAGRSQQTTISQVVAGQVPQGVSAAAAINLLVQGSKLTIVPAQSAVGEIYAMIAQMLFDYIKAYGESDLKIMVRDGVRPIHPQEIPDWMDIQVTLRSEMPQDKALLYNVALNAWKQGFISQETGWDMVGIEDKVKERERLDMEIRNATPEEMMAGRVSEPAQKALMAEQQQQMQAQQAAETNVGDATTAAQSGGLPFEQNPQAGGGVIDQLAAIQNSISNPMG
jgi:hypothetical protein